MNIKKKERVRESERESEEREERIHSLTQSSGTLFEVIAKWVYRFKMLSSINQVKYNFETMINYNCLLV